MKKRNDQGIKNIDNLLFGVFPLSITHITIPRWFPPQNLISPIIIPSFWWWNICHDGTPNVHKIMITWAPNIAFLHFYQESTQNNDYMGSLYCISTFLPAIQKVWNCWELSLTDTQKTLRPVQYARGKHKRSDMGLTGLTDWHVILSLMSRDIWLTNVTVFTGNTRGQT